MTSDSTWKSLAFSRKMTILNKSAVVALCSCRNVDFRLEMRPDSFRSGVTDKNGRARIVTYSGSHQSSSCDKPTTSHSQYQEQQSAIAKNECNFSPAESMTTMSAHLGPSKISGNGLFASRDFAAGEAVLLLSRPLVQALDTKRLGDTCANCLAWTAKSNFGDRGSAAQSASGVKACLGCHTLQYCSRV